MELSKLFTCAVLLAGSACQPSRDQSDQTLRTTNAVPATPLVLNVEEGERRVRLAQTTGLSSPFILKVDQRNGGSPDLVMGYEDIAPGHMIAPHRHLVADEIIFVHRGTGSVDIGDRQASFGPGATIYLPRNVRISVRNTGTEPLSIAFIFSKPGFEQYLRETSVPEGQPAPALSQEQRAAIRERHRWHVVYEQP
jgi:oxalate decarboxylase/phosphoglucose isomerase-like protein (cupin superfamily)